MAEDEELAAWRAELLAEIAGSDVRCATGALLALTYGEPDRVLLGRTVLGCLDEGFEWQVRALAVTCLGHVGRLYGAISTDMVARLRELLTDDALGGRAEDALGDVLHFAGEGT